MPVTSLSAAPALAPTPTLESGSRWVQRTFWMGVPTYGLIVFSSWSMAGMEASVILLHLLVLYHRVRTPVQDPLPAWVWLPFAGLAVMAVMSSLAAANPTASLAEALGDYRVFLPLVLLPALAQVNLRRLLTAYLAIASAIAAYGLVQYGWGIHLEREELENLRSARGFFTMYLTYAGVMLMVVPVFASLAAAEAGRRRWMWIGGAILTALAVIASLGRAGWLGLGVGLLVLALRLPRRWALAVLISAFVASSALGWSVMSGSLREAVSHRTLTPAAERLLTFEHALSNLRLPLWVAGWRGLWDAPVLGHGFDKREFDPYRAQVTKEWKIKKWGKPGLWPHNVYLEIGFMMGLPGLLMFLSMWGMVLAWCIVWIRRAGTQFPFESALLWGILAALSGSMVHGLFGGHFMDAEVQINILMWMGLALFTGLRVRSALAGSSAPGG